MTPDDVRMTAQLVVDKRVHCVSDEAVLEMARRVLELESERVSWALSVKTAEVHEREACAKLAERNGDHVTATSIRARGAK